MSLKSKIEKAVWENKIGRAERSVFSVVKSLGALSEHWLSTDFFYAKKAVARLTKKSGFSQGVAERLIHSLFQELTPPKLMKLLKSELPDPRVLDGFRKNPGGHLSLAAGPRLITHVFSANVPNPAIMSFVLGMLVKSVNAGKLSGRDPGFLEIYLESLRAHDARLAATNFLLPRDDPRALDETIALSDLVVVYGGDETVEAFRKKITGPALFSGYGHRASFAFISKDFMSQRGARELASKIALDIWMVDQRGCLSPLMVCVERGGVIPPFGFAQGLAASLDERCRGGEVKGDVALERIASHELLRNTCRMRRLKGERVHFWQSQPRGRWAVFYAERIAKPPAALGNLAVFVQAVDGFENFCDMLRPFKNHIQAVALEAPDRARRRMAPSLASLGVNRVTRAGRMQFPPITWHHDGRLNFAPWLTWTDLE